MGAKEDNDLLQPGTTFGRYQITRRLGTGGMGAVYEGLHPTLKKKVAIKVLHRRYADSEIAVTRFMREGEAASRIQHPNVVDVFDVGVELGMPYLVMEVLEGESLGALIERHGKLDPQRVVDILLAVTAAVAAAHDVGVIHRDLKPENIFLAKTRLGQPEPKVLDFGISKMTGDVAHLSLTGTAAFLGSPYYVSPEQARGAKMVDGRCDQFSLGVVAYEALTGKVPFDGSSFLELMHKIAACELRPLREVRPEVDPGLEAVLMKAMSKEPDHRYPTMVQLGAALLPHASTRVRALWEPTFLGQNTMMTTTPALDYESVPDTVAGEPRISGPELEDLPGAPTVAGPAPSDPEPERPTEPPREREKKPFEETTLGGAAREMPVRTQPALPIVPIAIGAGLGAVALFIIGLVVALNGQEEQTVTVPPDVTPPSLPQPVPTPVVTPETTPGVTPTPSVTPAPTPTPVVSPTPTTAPPQPTRVETPPRRNEPRAHRVTAIPSEATISLDGRALGTGTAQVQIPRDGDAHVLTVTAPGYRPSRFVLRRGDSPPGTVTLERIRRRRGGIRTGAQGIPIID